MNTTDINKIAEFIKILNDLIQDPHPGLFMWQQCFQDNLVLLYVQLKKMGIEKAVKEEQLDKE